MFTTDVATLNTLQVFVSGMVLALIFSLGLWMMGIATRLRRVHRQAEAAAIERDRLAGELADRQNVRTDAPAADDGT